MKKRDEDSADMTYWIAFAVLVVINLIFFLLRGR